MKELHRDLWHLNIEYKIFFWKYKRTYKFQTATLKELIEFSTWIKNEEDLLDWLFRFLCKHGKITKREFKQITPEKVNSILEYLKKTFGKGFFEETKKKTAEKAPISSFFALIMKNSGETTKSILSLTWGQIMFLSEGIIWNLNAQTKDGQKRNNRDFQKKKFQEELTDEEALKILKDREESTNK